MITFIGAASAFTESVLGQAYKIKNSSGVFMGGPAYYLEHGLKCKNYARLFAVLAVMGPGLLLPGVQINSLVLVFEEAFAVDRTIVGFICCALIHLPGAKHDEQKYEHYYGKGGKDQRVDDLFHM